MPYLGLNVDLEVRVAKYADKHLRTDGCKRAGVGALSDKSDKSDYGRPSTVTNAASK